MKIKIGVKKNKCMTNLNNDSLKFNKRAKYFQKETIVQKWNILKKNSENKITTKKNIIQNFQ